MMQEQLYFMHQNEKIVELSRFLLQTAFFIQYLNNQPVGLKTHILNTNTFAWIQTFFNVGDLVAAYKSVVAPFLDQSSLAELTIHLPVGIDRTTLTEDFFLLLTQLRLGLALSRLYGLTLDDLNPLIIKSKNGIILIHYNN